MNGERNRKSLIIKHILLGMGPCAWAICPCAGPSMPSLFTWYVKALILINKIMSLVSECPINTC